MSFGHGPWRQNSKGVWDELPLRFHVFGFGEAGA